MWKKTTLLITLYIPYSMMVSLLLYSSPQNGQINHQKTLYILKHSLSCIHGPNTETEPLFWRVLTEFGEMLCLI